MKDLSAAALAQKAMKVHNVKTKGLADLLGTSQSTAWRIATGESKPGSDTYIKLLQLSQAAA